MKPSIALMVAWLALAGNSAWASQTACTFEGGQPPQYYELEFIGYGDAKPMVVFSSTAFGAGKRITLPVEHYSVENFRQVAARLRLAFRNPGNEALPPSFTLSARKGEGRLSMGSITVDGALHCAD